MTKDGKPSRICDIRYFEPYKNSVKSIESRATTAFGKRLMCWLNGENYSCGHYPVLYVVLSATLEIDEVDLKEKPHGEWWYREAHIGVPAGLRDSPDFHRIAENATVKVLKFIRPDMAATIDEASKVVARHGDALRFLLKTKITKNYIVDEYASILEFPTACNIFTSLTDRVTGKFYESPPFPVIGFPAFHFTTGPIKITEILKDFPQFIEKERPVMSKLLKFR